MKGYAQRLAAEDAEFEDIVEFGKALQAIEDVNRADAAKVILRSKQYWRAVLEMTPQDSSILLAYAFLHAALGNHP
jgi:hypothetical protein